ncbi:MAG TPA: ATP-binding protein [Mucilaginibacter sp.]|nr:ATP-binding protein [Mucilaginibacter sp.]
MQERLPISEVTLILFGSTVIILLLTGLIIFSLFIHQKRKYRYRQEKSELKSSFDRELLRSQLEIQSQAFESISRELHDNVGTLISIAMVHLQLLNGEMRQKELQAIKEAGCLLNEAMGTLRDISKSIHPENIGRLGWQKSFIAELDRICKTNLFTVDYSIEGTPIEIEMHKQVIIFRILQETLNNIVKHSEGNHINTWICFSQNNVVIRIEDDGKGLEKDLLQLTEQGSGLRNMFARAAMLPATLTVEKRSAGGTVVALSYNEPAI